MKISEIFFREANVPQDVQPQEETTESPYLTYMWGSPFQGNNKKLGSPLELSSVFAAVSMISNSIAQLPIEVRDCSNDDVVLDDHPITLALRNGIISQYTMMKQVVHDLMLYGNAFIYIYWKGKKVDKLRYMPRGTVNIIYNEPSQELYYTSASVGSGKRIMPSDMIHLTINGEDGINGKGITHYAKRSIDLSDAAESSADNFFSSGCNLNGVVKVDGPLGPKQKKEIKDEWRQSFAEGNSGGIAVCGANTSYQQVSSNARDAQLTEVRQWNLTDIARFFGISPVILGDLSHSSYSTIEAANLQYLMHTLQPYISLIEAELNRKLCVDGKTCINLDESYFLKTDKTSMANYYGTLVEKGILTVNEARKQLGFPEVDGGDELHIAYSDINQNKLVEDSDSENQGNDEENQGNDHQNKPEE